MPKHRKSTVLSKTGFVQFFPDDIRPRKKKSEKNEKGKKVLDGKNTDGKKKNGTKTKKKKKKAAKIEL
jgi:hypothetical protein